MEKDRREIYDGEVNRQPKERLLQEDQDIDENILLAISFSFSFNTPLIFGPLFVGVLKKEKERLTAGTKRKQRIIDDNMLVIWLSFTFPSLWTMVNPTTIG